MTKPSGCSVESTERNTREKTDELPNHRPPYDGRAFDRRTGQGRDDGKANFNGHSDEKDVFVTSYKITVEGTYDGKDASGTYNAGSVWKMENAQWLAIFHTNVRVAGDMSPDAQKKE